MDVSQRANAVGNDLDQTLHGALAGTPSYLSCVSVLDTGCNALVFLSAPGGDESFIGDILLVGWLALVVVILIVVVYTDSMTRKRRKLALWRQYSYTLMIT